MASWSLTVSLLVSLVFMRFVSAADPTIIQATAGENIVLPCIDPDPGEIIVIEWRRTDLEKYVLLFRDGRIESENQDPSYQNRVDLNDNQMKDGDFSLILKNVTIDDRGTYECQVAKTNIAKKLISTVRLVVAPPPDPLPVWVKVLLVLLVLVLVAAPVLIFWLWHRFSVHRVKVESGVESVLLPWRWTDQLVSFRSTSRLPGDVRVEWKDEYNKKVHVTQKGSDCSNEQNQRYRNRTKMDKNLSLTLRWPTYEDNGFYTCRVYRDGVVMMKKEVQLKVKVQQVEVESGDKSVLLPWTIRESLDGDVRVEWRDKKYGDVVHVYQDGSDRPDEQTQCYKHRTRMDKNPLKTKNLSLTLMDPTVSDIYICKIYNRDGTVLMEKQVQLEVKDQQVEFDEGVESVKLPFRVTFDLQERDRVEWKDSRGRMVHVYQISSDQPVEQAEFYRTRTKMDEKLLETKDVSLTLIKPTKEDSGDYGCIVYRNGVLLRMKTFHLNIKGTIQDQPDDTRKRRISTDPTPLMADQSG